MRYLAPLCLALCPALALAGGSERVAPSSAILFKDGDLAEFNLVVADPKISGQLPLGALGNQRAGDITGQFFTLGFGLKRAFNERWDYALVYEQPHGADVHYASSDPLYPFAGSFAKLSEQRLTLWTKYRAGERLSLFGGPIIAQTKMRAQVITAGPNPATGARVETLNYTGSAPANSANGYALGAAYEIEDIALRVALTYFSELDYDTTATESAAGLNGAEPFEFETRSATSYSFPQSATLAFQSGINPKTLLFGAVRWAEWTANTIQPDLYATVTQGGSLVSHDNDTTTYTLGLGRRLNDHLTLLGRVSHEASQGGLASNLAPTDGLTSLTLGALYRQDQVDVLIGVTRTQLGDADTDAKAAGRGLFRDNSVNGVGLQVTTRF